MAASLFLVALQCPLLAVVSTGRRNTYLEQMRSRVCADERKMSPRPNCGRETGALAWLAAGDLESD